MTTALRRDPRSRGTEFPELLKELRAFFQPVVPGQTVQAVPGAGARVPIWLLGSSDFSARLAGELGLRFAAAGRFAPDNLVAGLAAYRDNFRPSGVTRSPLCDGGSDRNRGRH
jgi:alkanesulfonate monooxygenase SsuD/methylene tetrahydromethanopterin reductase-like flavin-dependent oxidoreductase (luciferase family)